MSRIHRPMTGRRAGTMSKIALMAWVAALCACTSPPPTPEPVVAQVIPAGYGRLWLYRAYEPGDTLARPTFGSTTRWLGSAIPAAGFIATCRRAATRLQSIRSGTTSTSSLLSTSHLASKLM
jgi:hypothetical protein